jgi:hypothetical protein
MNKVAVDADQVPPLVVVGVVVVVEVGVGVVVDGVAITG